MVRSVWHQLEQPEIGDSGLASYKTPSLRTAPSDSRPCFALSSGGVSGESWSREMVGAKHYTDFDMFDDSSKSRQPRQPPRTSC